MIRFTVCGVFVSLGLMGTAALAQGPQGPVRVPEVHMTAPATGQQTGQIRLNVEVATKSGTPEPGLAQSDFALLDNGSPRPITGFRVASRAQEPVEVILVVDAVNARFDTVAYERAQIEKYLRSSNGKLPVPFTIGYLTDKGVQMQQGSSRDGNSLSQAMEANAPGLREVTRAAGFWGANERLQTSLEGIQQVIEFAARQPGRKLVLWASPGWPLLSGPGVDLDAKQHQQIFDTVVSYSSAMRQGDVTLYSLDPLGPSESLLREDYYQTFLKGIRKATQTDLADLSVQVLAMQSGGQIINSTDMGRSIQRCLADAESWYELSFGAAHAEQRNEYHHVEVRVNRPGLVVRTRDGYYAQP